MRRVVFDERDEHFNTFIDVIVSQHEPTIRSYL